MIAGIPVFQKAIREEALDGWFFYNFQHRDSITDYLLGFSPETVNTRPWVYLIPAKGEPKKLVSAVERQMLKGLPGDETVYYSRAEFAASLSGMLKGRVGMQFSTELPVLSYLDYGTMRLVSESGAEPVSSASLVQRLAGVLDKRGIASHNAAAVKLYAIVEELWSGVRAASDNALYEGDVLEWLEELLIKNKLFHDHSPIVAAGENSGDPHYSLTGRGALIKSGDVIQIDVWAKESRPSVTGPAHDTAPADAIYADISWVGVFAPQPDKEERELFDLLTRARDEAVRYIEKRLAAADVPSGADVDRHVRSFFGDNNVSGLLRHRTGHGIDRLVHGWGVNLDCVEFPDNRKLIDGACFSVEPGLYGKRFGMRSEINAYIEGGKPVVSGGKPQTRLLTL